MSKNGATHARENPTEPHEVLLNDDLLTEILIRLPILCLYLFTSVSKHWRKILTSPGFTRNRSKIHNLDPPAGLFVRHIKDPFKCYFVSLDSRLQSRKVTAEKSFGLASTEALENVKLVQSCNGLLLCTGPSFSSCYYVYNPSTKLFKMLPPPVYTCDDSPSHLSVALIIAFDPTKSINYKVVFAGQTSPRIQTYCSETRKWSMSKDKFPVFSFLWFDSAIYFNGALHWLNIEEVIDGLVHYKLSIEDHDHPILTTKKIHQGLHWGSYFHQPLGYNIPRYRTIRLQRYHMEGKLFKSRGCLLAVLRDYISSKEFTIFEMRKGCSVWSVRYLVNTNDFINPLPEGWSIWSTVWSIFLGEMEEDSCLVINVSGKFLKFNLISKSLREIYDTESNQFDENLEDDRHIMPFEADHGIYEFIPSSAIV